MRRGCSLLLMTLLGAAVACSDGSGITAPIDDVELPEPDTSLNPDRLVVGNYLATPCHALGWGDGLAHLQDQEEWAFVDIFFGRMSADDPLDGPTGADLQLVRSVGGWILHEFNVPAVRARILLSKVPELVVPDRVREGHWITVRDVPDATRYDLELGVGFLRPLSDADIELFELLGGRVTRRYGSINGISGILPDRSVPALRAHPDVSYVEVSGVACLS